MLKELPEWRKRWRENQGGLDFFSEMLGNKKISGHKDAKKSQSR